MIREMIEKAGPAIKESLIYYGKLCVFSFAIYAFATMGKTFEPTREYQFIYWDYSDCSKHKEEMCNIEENNFVSSITRVGKAFRPPYRHDRNIRGVLTTDIGLIPREEMYGW